MATAQETTIADQLRALIRLQHIDSRIDQIKKLRGDLPDEIRDLEDEKTGLQTRIANIEQEQQENIVARRQSQLDIQESEALIKKYEEQQLQVRNNREYDALTKEIEAQRARILEATSRTEEIAEREGGYDASISEAQTRLAELEEVLEGKRSELNNVLQDTKEEQEALEARRAAASEEVETRYLRAYERLRERLRDGRAVVPLDRGAAGGFAIPPQRQVDIRQGARIVACEHTGRIVVDGEMYRQVVEETGV
jgi:uncharacterized protein